MVWSHWYFTNVSRAEFFRSRIALGELLRQITIDWLEFLPFMLCRVLRFSKSANTNLIFQLIRHFVSLANERKDARSVTCNSMLRRQMPSGMEAPSRALSEATTSRLTSGDLSSFSTSDALTGPQLPSSPSVNMTPGDVSMAGVEPSIRKNLIDPSDSRIGVASSRAST